MCLILVCYDANVTIINNNHNMLVEKEMEFNEINFTFG